MKSYKRYGIKGKPIRVIFMSLALLTVFSVLIKLQSRLNAQNLKHMVSQNSDCEGGIKIRKSGGESAIGHHAINIGIQNTCKTNIQLSGYPSVVLIGADGKDADLNVINSPSTFFLKANPVDPIVIKPGKEAYFQIEFSSVSTEKKCVPVSKLRITLPGIDGTFDLNVQMKPCGERVQVSPFRSSVSSNN